MPSFKALPKKAMENSRYIYIYLSSRAQHQLIQPPSIKARVGFLILCFPVFVVVVFFLPQAQPNWQSRVLYFSFIFHHVQCYPADPLGTGKIKPCKKRKNTFCTTCRQSFFKRVGVCCITGKILNCFVYLYSSAFIQKKNEQMVKKKELYINPPYSTVYTRVEFIKNIGAIKGYYFVNFPRGYRKTK